MRADLREHPREASTATPAPPLTQLSYSRGSPNVIAAIGASWTRSHEPDQIAAELRRPAR